MIALLSPYCLAFFLLQIMAAEAPSLIGQLIRRVSGEQIMGDPSTSAMLNFF